MRAHPRLGHQEVLDPPDEEVLSSDLAHGGDRIPMSLQDDGSFLSKAIYPPL